MKRNGGKKLSFLVDTRVSASQAIKMFVISRFLEIDQSETRIDCGGHVCSRIRTK
jgi:hypothetical protein